METPYTSSGFVPTFSSPHNRSVRYVDHHENIYIDGHTIEIDIKKHQLNLLVDEKTIAIRRSHYKTPTLRVKSGVLYKYAKQVKTAADGCVTDED